MLRILQLLWVIFIFKACFCEECDRELRRDIDFPGNDVLQIYSPDVLHCQQACNQHHSCQFFTFIRPDWTRDNRLFYCYLKHTSSGQPSRVTELEGVTSGYPNRNCKTDGCSTSVYEDVDFYGADYKTFFTADYMECQRACTLDQGCQFFSWLNNNYAESQYRYKCHLKFSWTTPKPPKVKVLSGVTSGFSTNLFQAPKVEQCMAEIFNHTDFPGHDLEQVPAVSAEHCQFLCSAHPKCTYFSYTTSEYATSDENNKMLCFLKHSQAQKPMQPLNNVHSGMPSRFCQTPRDWANVHYENIDFPGFDLRYEKLDNTEACESLCTSDPNCQFFTYVHTRFYEANFRKRCYLKRVTTLPVPPKIATLSGVVSGFSMRDCKNSRLVP